MGPVPANGTGSMTTKLPVGDLSAMLKQYNVTNPLSIKHSSSATVSSTTNVNVQQQGNPETISRIPEIISSMSSVPSISTSSCTTLVDGSHISRKHPTGSQTSQQYHTNRTRLNTTPSASTLSNSNCSAQGLPGSSNSPGPIRHKSRRHETSPFERKPAATDGCIGVDSKLL